MIKTTNKKLAFIIFLSAVVQIITGHLLTTHPPILRITGSMIAVFALIIIFGKHLKM